MAFTSFRSPAHEIAHTPMAISRDGSDAYLLSLRLAGRAELSQGGRDTVLKPGDLGIVDARRPFSVKLSGDVWRAAAILPRRMVHRYAPVWRDLLALRIGNSEPAVDLVREYLLRLADPAFAVHSVVAEVLARTFPPYWAS